jgi:transcriptional regulator with XRE-family HTH domain
MPAKVTLGTRLKRLREERGWSQAQLAERVGLTQAYIALLETGKRKRPSRPAIKVLADALGVAEGDLSK